MVEDQNYNQESLRYLVLPYAILGNKDLSMQEKFVLARIAGFRVFFESSQATAEFLGLSALVVERAKRNLVKLGYVEELANTGRGKVYRAVDIYDMLDRLDQKVISDLTKKSYQTLPKSKTENKVENKVENNSDSKESLGESPSDESKEKETFGNKHINALMELWEAETGITANRAKANRYACYNLLRTRGYDGAEAVVRMVGRSIRSRDQYAPRIGSFRDLVGKYEKLSNLEAWNARQTTPKARIPHIQQEQPEYFDFYKPQSEEEREEVKKSIEAARERLGFARRAD